MSKGPGKKDMARMPRDTAVAKMGMHDLKTRGNHIPKKYEPKNMRGHYPKSETERHSSKSKDSPP